MGKIILIVVIIIILAIIGEIGTAGGLPQLACPIDPVVVDPQRQQHRHEDRVTHRSC